MAQNGPDGEQQTPPSPRDLVVWQARTLLRAARAATLATQEGGQPYAALVTPAPAPDLSLLVLLSGLSAHTRHLAADGRCALMVTGDATDANPQTAPRLTVMGVASPEPDPALKARWVARHPYAGFYAGLGDFRLVRIRPTGGQFIGGFASAHRMSAEALTPAPEAVAAVAAAEACLIAEADSAMVARLAGEPGWRLAAVDVDGCDLVRDEAIRRLAWEAPASNADGVRAALARLATAAPASLRQPA